MATLLDSTMEEVSPETHSSKNLRILHSADPETDAPEDEDDDEDFNFNAPSYYDLKNPALERRYVNNADGYFSSPTRSAATSKGSPLTTEISCTSSISEPALGVTLDASNEIAGSTQLVNGKQDESMEEINMLDTTMPGIEDVETVLNTSNLLDDREESFKEVFRHYASSSQSSATSSYLLHDLDTSTHSSIHAGHFSPLNSHASSSSTSMRANSDSIAKSRFRAANTAVSSNLMQPTQSYSRRIQAEQMLRQELYVEDAPVENKPSRVTRPRSPKLRTKTRTTHSNDASRMSSTSRELLKIQEERLLLQLEKLKIREFHEKIRVQRPPTNVHQRSTKQLTIPQTPHFQVDNRIRRVQSGPDTSESGHVQNQPPIAAEKLLTRDYSKPFPPYRESRLALTTPRSPKLHTATRAAHRPPPAPVPDKKVKAAVSRVNGSLTQPMTPQLETRRRAAQHRRPIKVIDQDAEELAKKFHAKPLNKSILEPKLYTRYAPAKSDGKSCLAAPRAAPSAFSASCLSSADRSASVLSEAERHRKEREQRLKTRQAGQATQQLKSAPRPIRRPLIAETPPLKSIQLHRKYQEKFSRKIEIEEKEKEKQRQFKANPIRVASTPAKFECSSKPLTEVKPFELPGEQYLNQAHARLEQKRRDEEERLKALGTFRAKPMPVFESDLVQIVASTKPLTQTESPMLATKRRAAERAAFEAAEKERQAREEAFRQQREEQERQLKDEEIKRLRREEMVFHARPVPDGNTF